MGKSERQDKIKRILAKGQLVIARELAKRLCVTTRTIMSDITELTKDYPIETKAGNGGGIKFADGYEYKEHTPVLDAKEVKFLTEAATHMGGEHADVIMGVIKRLT